MKKFEIKITSNGETHTKEVEALSGWDVLVDNHQIIYLKLADDNNFTIELKEI